MTVQFWEQDLTWKRFIIQYSVQFHKSTRSPFTTLQFHIEHINSFDSVCLLARTVHLEGVLRMLPISMNSVLFFLWTVGQWGALMHWIARRWSSLIGGNINPHHFPISRCHYCRILPCTRTHTNTRTHTHTHTRRLSQLSSSLCTCARKQRRCALPKWTRWILLEERQKQGSLNN